MGSVKKAKFLKMKKGQYFHQDPFQKRSNDNHDDLPYLSEHWIAPSARDDFWQLFQDLFSLSQTYVEPIK